MFWFLWTVFMFSLNIVFAGLAAYNGRPVFCAIHAALVVVFYLIANEMRKEL